MDLLKFSTKAVRVLLVVNVLMFGLSYALPNLTEMLALHYYKSSLFRPFQLLTHLFMHGGFAHLAFNMYALLMFGSVVERQIKTPRFLTLYFLAGIGAFVLHMLVVSYQLSDLPTALIEEFRTQGLQILTEGKNYADEALAKNNLKFNGAMVGASGAIMGVLAAFGVLYPNMKLGIIFIPVYFKAKYFIPFYMAIELFLGVKEFSWDNIAHFAHIGGALVGFGLMMSWKKEVPRNQFS